MKTLILISSFFVVFHKGDKNLQCSDFKKGKFELIDLNSNTKSIIKRKGDLQTEEMYDMSSGEKISKTGYFKITWTNECEYNLMIDTIKNEINEVERYINSKGGVDTKITNINGKCAQITYSAGGQYFSAELCKIK